MTSTHLIAALASVGLFVAGVATGRISASVPVAEKLISFDQEKLTVLRFASTHTWSTSWSVKRVTAWRKWVKLPDGTESLEERSGSEDASGTDAGQKDVTADLEQKERIVYVNREQVPVPPPELPRWLLGASVQPGLTGVSGGSVTGGVRVVGPAWATATGGRVRGEWYGTVGVGVMF